ncbi:MAG: hypothetical protein E7355_05500 [Clostridiales bacterium]|nr:hypothetical protein [Clostridiales bacterium]
MYDFLVDLDDYFCEKYSNYDKLCVLQGYRMPVMQATKTDEFGRTVSYTLPSSTMRLALQENKADILKSLKERILDKGFSFSFRPIGLFRRIKNAFVKNSPKKVLTQLLDKYKTDKESAIEDLKIEKEIWRNICKGKFAPTKNTIFSLALTGHYSLQDAVLLLQVNGYAFDFDEERDVVVAYLLEKKVFARPMIEAAFAEYKVDNLFIK